MNKIRNRRFNNPISEKNREDLIFFGSFAVITVAAIVAVVKINAAEVAKIQQARELGATVIETPFGNFIYSD